LQHFLFCCHAHDFRLRFLDDVTAPGVGVRSNPLLGGSSFRISQYQHVTHV